MKKIIIAVMLFVPLILSSCTLSEVNYGPRRDYVYATGHAGYRPYWNSFYSGHGWGNVGYWRGVRGYYDPVSPNQGWSNQGWFTRGWHGHEGWYSF